MSPVEIPPELIAGFDQRKAGVNEALDGLIRICRTMAPTTGRTGALIAVGHPAFSVPGGASDP